MAVRGERKGALIREMSCVLREWFHCARVNSTATVVMARVSRCTPTETSTRVTGSKVKGTDTESCDAQMEPLMKYV